MSHSSVSGDLEVVLDSQVHRVLIHDDELALIVRLWDDGLCLRWRLVSG